MQRNRIVVAAAVVTAAGAAVAFTLPSNASTNPAGGSAAPARVAAADGGVSPQMLKAMQRDLGLSEGQARSLLERQTWAGKVTRSLKAEVGGAYAGAWLAKDGTTLNVAVTDKDMADEVTATGAQAKLVERSERELTDAKARLDAAAGPGARSLRGWYIDVTANKVVVLAKPGDGNRARRLAAAAGLDDDAVMVKPSAAQPRTLADIQGADAYFANINGQSARCSVGFGLVGGGFATAGHCGAVGTETTDQAGQPVGLVVRSTFPGAGDKGVVRVGDDSTLLPEADDFNGGALPVAGNAEAPIGAAVCRTGSTTGLNCGRIIAKNQTVNFAEGTVTGLTQTDACAEGGDSGGPFLAGNQAQGVVSGGSGDCTVGGETFFQPINEILEDDNLTLLTTGNAGN